MSKYGLEKLITARYSNSIVVPKKKNITFNLEEEMLERLDNVVSMFNDKDGLTTTRNVIIEEALLAYLETAEDFFEKKAFENDVVSTKKDYDLAILPAINDNFNKIFLGEHKWINIRIAEHRINNIKYIALYRGKPCSAITHYAEVISISSADVNNKRVIELKEPIELRNPIILGDVHVNTVRKLFYTTLEKLLKAKEIKDIIC